MKILLYGNSPAVSSGYGVQLKYLARRLRDDGHDVAIAATFGQQGSGRTWEGIQIYPQGNEINGNDVIHNHALMHFDGDPLGGWIIALNDLWVVVNPLLKDYNVAGWCPVDHIPVPGRVANFFTRTNAVPIAMSRFGERMLSDNGLDPYYVPLSVDTNVYKPTPTYVHGDTEVSGRELLGIADEAFLVGMVAMNKDPDDRKGFNEAFRAFGNFWRTHNDAVLYVHTSRAGYGSFDLGTLAMHCGIPPHAIKFPDEYALKLGGLQPEQMAAIYSSFDVLLAPSRGEGFCVPLIEAQACGTPVIAGSGTAQPELIGAGWKVAGQPYWDPAQEASWIIAFVPEIVDRLEDAYNADLDELGVKAVEFASKYDADRVYDEHWRPLLELMEANPEPLPLNRDEPFEVDVVVPVMRPENLASLVYSFKQTAPRNAHLHLVYDGNTRTPDTFDAKNHWTGEEHTTFAEKVNQAFADSFSRWVLLVGDDVEFHAGWFEAAEKLADRYDVIGTNDSLPGRIRNVEVADGKHADHFFVRRSYVEEYGASLDGPGVLAPECYVHFYVDKEIVELAKAREAFAPCLDSIVEHHHPGYDRGELDLVYLTARANGEADEATYESRLPLIRMQRRSLGRRS